MLILSNGSSQKINSMQTETPAPIKDSGYAVVNGIKMYYEIYGRNEGMPLVLIHGGGSTIQSNWETILPILSKNYKVIAMDLQAHGRTGDRNAPESFEQDAADVVTLLQHLKINKANIIGFSNGGTTTLQIAMNYSDMVNKIVLISCNYKRDGMMPGFFEGLQKVTYNDMPQPLKDAYLKANPDQEGLLNMFNKDRERMLSFKDFADEQIKSIKASALIVTGDRDVITTDHAVQMSKLIAGARLSILPGTHGSFIGEALTKEQGSKMPGIAVGIIEEFLNQ
jgi:pimeloyl-ACP methyl ester carboxylesterase